MSLVVKMTRLLLITSLLILANEPRKKNRIELESKTRECVWMIC